MTGWTSIGPLAYRGKRGCLNPTCTHRDFNFADPEHICYGWHCSYCDEPCSYQGHRCDAAEAVLGEARRLLNESGGE